MNNENSEERPWKNGYYRMRGMPLMIFHVEGNKVTNEYASGRTSNHGVNPSTTGTWTYGDFGDAKEDVAKESGKKNYNVDINI